MSEEKNEIIWKDRKHWLWFPFSFTKYAVKKDRLYTETGFFTTRSNELLLYRIVDLSLTRTFLQKICATGTICIHSRVDKDQELHLVNIKNSARVKDLLSDLVEDARNRKQVVGKEFYSGPGAPPLEDAPDYSDDFMDASDH